VSSAVGKGKIHILSQAVQLILGDFDMRYTNRRVFTRGGAFFMVRTQYFDIFTLKPQKNHFWYMVKSQWQIIYEHNCTMHRTTTLKFGWLFHLTKYLKHA